MENHPIPQDITGFQFKLIGDMTLKQFAFLAGGIIIGWIIYSLPILIFIRIPLAAFLAILGTCLAFVPIGGRPMDVMIKNYFKAIFSPTQYVYQKGGGDLLQTQANIASGISKNQKGDVVGATREKQLTDIIKSLPKGKNKLDQKETVFFQALNNNSGQPVGDQTQPAFVGPHAFANQAPLAPAVQPKAPVKKIEENRGKEELDEDLKKTAAILEKELQAAKTKELADKVDTKEYLEAHQKVLDLQKNLNDLLSQKQDLETKLMDLQKELQKKTDTVYSASTATSEPQKETKFVRNIPQGMGKSVGLPIAPEFPNVVTGIIKDPRGNPLPNILVEVKDADGNAVRAFKTNALGQFASATPLTNGDYVIEFEDTASQNKFDTVGFKANGEIILPIEVISVDTREELRRSLFN
jgi:hypothetical protein